jgi:hypothetical protein
MQGGTDGLHILVNYEAGGFESGVEYTVEWMVVGVDTDFPHTMGRRSERQRPGAIHRGPNGEAAHPRCEHQWHHDEQRAHVDDAGGAVKDTSDWSRRAERITPASPGAQRRPGGRKVLLHYHRLLSDGEWMNHSLNRSRATARLPSRFCDWSQP